MAPSWDRKKLPSLLKALEEPAGSDERAKKLTEIALEWFDAHRWYVREAIECEAHDKGAHYGYFDDRTNLWVGNTLSEEPDRVRVTANVTKAVIDQATAMLTQDAPIFRTTPGQSGIAAAAANETARAFLDHAWRFHNLDDLYRSTGRSAFSTGTSFVLLEWDRTKGPLQVAGYEQPQAPAAPAPGETPTPEEAVALGAEVPEGAPILPMPARPKPIYRPQGDLIYRTLMRDQVAFDPTSRVPGGGDGLGVVVRWKESRASLMEKFPAKFGDLPDKGAESDRNSFDEERTQRTTSVTPSTTGYEKKADDSLDVLCFYLRSRDGRPRGDYLMVCEGKMLLEEENDIYPTEEEMARGELWPSEIAPLFTFIADERANCPWGRARTVDAIPLQHAINGALSKALQHASIMANVKYVLPAGMDFDPSDEPGQVARVAQRFWAMTGGKPVQMTQPPLMPPEYLQIVQTGRELLEVVVGVNAASMGQAPTNEPSGRLTNALAQRDNTRIAPIKRSHDNQWGRVQTYALRLMRRYATGERLLRVVGEDLAVSQKFFNVADLAAGTEVYVVNDTSLPRDPQQRMMLLQTLTQTMANLQTQEDKDMILDLMRVPDIADFQQRKSPHHVKAIRNSRLLLLGESDGGSPPPGWPPNTPVPAPWDNPLIHKAELERFATSSEYLDRVKAEKTAPENMGQSSLEQRTVALWMYWAEKSMPQPQMMAPPMPGGQAPPAAPPAAPTGLATAA